MTRIFLDGPSRSDLERFISSPSLSGVTTNPTLFRQLGATDYLESCAAMAELVGPMSLSLEVLTESPKEILRQARVLAGLGERIFVKVPIITTKGASLASVIRELTSEGVRCNVTAIFTGEQFDAALESVEHGESSILSVFAGRIADTGRDPIPIMAGFRRQIGSSRNVDLLWASAREVLNLEHARAADCQIITLSPALFSRLDLEGKPLKEYSIETVKMFMDDASAAGYSF